MDVSESKSRKVGGKEGWYLLYHAKYGFLLLVEWAMILNKVCLDSFASQNLVYRSFHLPYLVTPLPQSSPPATQSILQRTI